MFQKSALLLLLLVLIGSSYSGKFNHPGLKAARQGNYLEAIAYYKRDLKVQISKHGRHHPSTFNSYNNIGIAYTSLGKFSDARKYLKLAIKTASRQKMNSGQLAMAYHNLAISYLKQSKPERAIQLLKTALKIRLIEFGEKHPDVIENYLALAMAYGDRELYDYSIKYNRRARKIAVEILKSDHPYIKQSSMNLFWAISERAKQVRQSKSNKKKRK